MIYSTKKRAGLLSYNFYYFNILLLLFILTYEYYKPYSADSLQILGYKNEHRLVYRFTLHQIIYGVLIMYTLSKLLHINVAKNYVQIFVLKLNESKFTEV